MAASSNRSPSPSSATSRSNPNPRNSEISNTVRRSFSGNPFTKPSIVAHMKGVNPVTPTNSPAGFPRRHSTGKEGGPPHHNEKENEKDQTPKPVRIRSPSVPKVTAKNFMSPTISAASKITASPRKKILGERNELIRTSVSSSSDEKGILGSLKIQEVVEDLNSKPASSDSTVVDPDHRKACSSPSRAKEDFQVPKSNPDTEFLSENISGSDVCPKSKPSPSPSWTSRSLAALDADPSLPPYDPKTNYLSPRPRFLHYKPNPRIEKIRLRECNRLEDCFTSEVPSDTETSEETQSEKSSCVVLMEGQDEEAEDSEAALQETAQDKPNVSEISTTEEEEDSEAALEETDQVKPNVPEKSSPVVLMEGQDEEEEDSDADLEETAQALQPRAHNSKSHSFGLKPMSMLLLLLLVGCLWRPISDSPLISSVIDSSIGKHSSFTKFSEPPELAEFVRTNVDGLTRNFWLWSTNMVSYFSKMIPTLKEQNELSFLRLGNYTDSVKEQILQCPMKEMIGILPIKEQGNLVSEAYGKAEGGASQVHPQSEDAKMIEEAEIIEPDQSALEQIQEYHAASPSEPGQASQGEPEFKESNLSLQDEVLEPHTSEVQQTEEESFQAEAEQASSHAKPESEELSLSPQDEAIEPHHNLEVQRTEEESKLISHEAEVVEVQQTEEPQSILAEAEVVTSHTHHEAQSIMSEKEKEAQVPQVSEIESEMPQVDKLHGEVEPSVAAVPEPESSQSFKELCLSLKEKSSNFNILGISSLILILTIAAASIFARQKKSPTPSAPAIPMDQLLVKKLASMPTASVENTYEERRLSSRNWPTEVDMIGESCPSEMSSFQKTTSSYSKKESNGLTEAQSQERGLRKSNKRESLASSSEYSTGSPSYGSFTSYEKIHSKHGCGDQEVVTPVRRSSRIRKQVVTSS